MSAPFTDIQVSVLDGTTSSNFIQTIKHRGVFINDTFRTSLTTKTDIDHFQCGHYLCRETTRDELTRTEMWRVPQTIVEKFIYKTPLNKPGSFEIIHCSNQHNFQNLYYNLKYISILFTRVVPIPIT